MKRRNWEAKTKATIVLQGLKGKPVAEICAEHQISQAQYYQWRDQFLENAPKAFDSRKEDQKLAALQRENAKLKHHVGELTIELKKNDGSWE